MTPKTTSAKTDADRLSLADSLAAAITDQYAYARCRAWQAGDKVRVYVNDGRDRGYLDVAPGLLIDQTKGVSSPVSVAVSRVVGS